VQGLKFLPSSRAKDTGSFEPVKGGLGGVKAAFDPNEAAIRLTFPSLTGIFSFYSLPSFKIQGG
jgi:hypothetical protein